jgi:competence protein ComEC
MQLIKEYPLVSFFRKPFVLIFSFFAAGILTGFLSEFLQRYAFLVLAFLPVLLILLWIYRKNKRAYLPLMMTGFFLSGMLLMFERNGILDTNKWDSVYRSNDLASVRIDEVNGGTSEWKKMTGTVLSLRNSHRYIDVNERVVLFVKTDSNTIEDGDVLLVAAPFESIVNAGNPGEFDAAYFWRSKGIRKMAFIGAEQFSFLYQEETGWITKSLNTTRNTLQQLLKDHMEGDELAIALALILGDKSLLDTEVKNSFTNTGAMHVLAVSGLHVGIIMQILLFILGFFPRLFSKKSSILIVVTLMWIYAVITGLSPSVLRAVFMFSVLVLSQLTERNYDAMNTLFFTGVALCLIDPITLLDIGFQLSFLAMMGIFLLYKPIEQLLYFENKLLQKVWQGTAIGFAAQFMTTPLSLYYFHQFPNYFVLTNIGLMASSGIILGGGLFLFAFGWLRPLGKLVGWILTISVFLSLGFIRWVESLPGAVAYGFDLGLLTVLIAGLWVLMMFLLKLNEFARWIAYAFGVLLLSMVVYTRFTHLELREICVLNAKFPAVLVKSGEKLFCFHDADTDEKEKLQFAVEAYRKVYPGEVRYFSMKRNWTLSGKEIIAVKDRKGGKMIVVNGKKIFLQARNGNVEVPKGTTVIGMPWVRSSVDHSLKDGAYRSSIN